MNNLKALFRIRFCLILILSLLFGCEFQPMDVPLNQSIQPSNSTPTLLVQVVPDMDTLMIASTVTVEFDLSTSEKKINQVEIRFDGILKYKGEYNDNSRPRVFIDGFIYNEGFHQFEIKTYVGAGSGSIAAEIGAENYLFQSTWPVYIQHGANILIKGVTIKNGFAEVEWNEYKFSDFDKYSVIKYHYTSGEYVIWDIYDPKKFRFSDSTFIEGDTVSYSIRVNDTYSAGFDFAFPIDTPECYVDANKRLAVEWNVTQNPGNLSKYYITSKAPLGDNDEEKIINLASVNQTTFSPPGFGSSYKIQVRHVPNRYTNSNLEYVSSGGLNYFSLGNKMPEFEFGEQLGNSEKTLLYWNGKFQEYDILENAVTNYVEVDSRTYPQSIVVTPDGKFFGYFTDDEFVIRETSTFNVVYHFLISGFSFGSNVKTIALSDNLKLLVVDYGNNLVVFDMLRGIELYNHSYANEGVFIESVKINSTGTKILIYKEQFNDFKLSITFNDFNDFELIEKGKVSFLPDNNVYHGIPLFDFSGDDIILIYNKEQNSFYGEIRNSDDFSILKTQKFPSMFVPEELDPVSRQVVLRYPDYNIYSYSYHVDLNSGLTQKISPLVGINKFLLLKGVIMSGCGRYMSLNELKK